MFQFASIFQDHAVLQRDIPLPVWGTAPPDALVSVRLAGQVREVLASCEGEWLVRFAPLGAGGPWELVAECGGEEVVCRDVLVGDVWVCSGQSNMEWRLADNGPMDAETAVADLPQIRVLKLSTPPRLGRRVRFSERWRVGSPETLHDFSGVASWFGRKLHGELGVPVGLIENSYGGSRIEAWMSREVLVEDARTRREVNYYEGYVFTPEHREDSIKTSLDTWLAEVAQKFDTGNRGLAEGWAAADFDDSRWVAMPVPDRWQNNGFPNNGAYWYRRRVELPAHWRGKSLELHLAKVDAHDDTYVNGERIGGVGWENPIANRTLRIYDVPAHLAVETLVIAVRVCSPWFFGGLVGPEEELFVALAGTDEKVSLAGEWRFAQEQDWGKPMPTHEWVWGQSHFHSPYILFDSRVAPLIPYGIKGVIWYQGEANTEGSTVAYRKQMRDMIRDWRRAWGQGDFAFLMTQLANYGPPISDSNQRSLWSEIREAQAMALDEPATGLAIAIDLGQSDEIHPPNKKDIGLRLARWALSETYRRGGLPTGPIYRDAIFEPGRVRILFDYAEGLRTRDGEAVKYLAIGGRNGMCIEAQSRIEGDTLLVWHPDIALPATVRYAWADNPEGCNLVNADDLPASPFRTDS